jgi:hypothetical protein
MVAYPCILQGHVIFDVRDSKIPSASKEMSKKEDVEEGFQNLHDDVELIRLE